MFFNFQGFFITSVLPFYVSLKKSQSSEKSEILSNFVAVISLFKNKSLIFAPKKASAKFVSNFKILRALSYFCSSFYDEIRTLISMESNCKKTILTHFYSSVPLPSQLRSPISNFQIIGIQIIVFSI